MPILIGVLVLLVAGAIYQAIGAVRDARRYPAPGSMIDVGRHRLHARCVGAGAPAVVFEAGIAASSLSWTRVLPDVGTVTRACAYDRAGLGWSEVSSEPATPRQIVGELRALLTRMPVDAPVVLVGHSFGALIVSIYASWYPADVAGLVLLDPPIEWHAPTPEQSRIVRGGILFSRLGGALARVGVVRASLALLAGGAPGAPRRFVKIFGPSVAATLERMVGEVRKLPDEVHPFVRAHWCEPRCFRAMARYIGALDETVAAVAALERLPDVPLVVISAEDQPEERLAEHRALAGLSRRGRHLVALGSGHWIQLDRPDLVANVIRELVDEVRRGSASGATDSRR